MEKQIKQIYSIITPAVTVKKKKKKSQAIMKVFRKFIIMTYDNTFIKPQIKGFHNFCLQNLSEFAVEVTLGKP